MLTAEATIEQIRNMAKSGCHAEIVEVLSGMGRDEAKFLERTNWWGSLRSR